MLPVVERICVHVIRRGMHRIIKSVLQQIIELGNRCCLSRRQRKPVVIINQAAN